MLENFNINENKARKISISWISVVIGISLIVVYAGIFSVTPGGYTNQVAKVLLKGGIQAIKNSDTEQALNYLIQADKGIPIIGGNSTSKSFIEDAISALKNNDTKHALVDLEMVPNP